MPCGKVDRVRGSKMSQVIYNSDLNRIALALEEQNKLYRKVNEKADRRYEAKLKDDALYDSLIAQVVSLNERLAHMANTIDDQNRVILEQARRLSCYEKALDREGRDEVDSPG